MAENKNNKIGFSLKNIKTEQFACIEASYIENDDVDMQAGLEFGVDFKNKIVSVSFSSRFIQDKATFLIIEVRCFFKIRENAWSRFYEEEETKLIIPRRFISHLVMLTIGTTRGVLHSKTEGTPFNKFLLPTLNVNELVEEDITFKIEVDDH